MQASTVKMLDERWNKAKPVLKIQSIHRILPITVAVLDAAMTYFSEKSRISLAKLEKECETYGNFSVIDDFMVDFVFILNETK